MTRDRKQRYDILTVKIRDKRDVMQRNQAASRATQQDTPDRIQARVCNTLSISIPALQTVLFVCDYG